MKIEIKKERTHLFAPNINIAMMFQISGNIEYKELQDAIAVAVKNNEILSCKIQLEKNGDAYYCPSDSSQYSFTVLYEDWKEVIKKQASKPFDLEHGELIRFFALPDNGTIRLLLIAHHLAGDGLSIAYLVEDILASLSGKPILYKPLQLCSPKDFDKECTLNPFLRFIIKSLNKKWDKAGKSFTFEDYNQMFQNYWVSHEIEIFRETIHVKELARLSELSKLHSVTLNSAITAAFLKSAEDKSSVGMAVSVRPKGYYGMGNYATGISIQYTYDKSIDFWRNTQIVHSLIYKKLNQPSKKYFLLKFMDKIRPTLIDAAYFSAFGGYNNKTAKSIQNMFGYNGNVKGISITNLGRLPIQSNYEGYPITDFAFVPPLVPNAKRMIGISTLNETLEFTMCIEKSKNISHEKEFFNRAIDTLRKLS